MVVRGRVKTEKGVAEAGRRRVGREKEGAEGATVGPWGQGSGVRGEG